LAPRNLTGPGNFLQTLKTTNAGHSGSQMLGTVAHKCWAQWLTPVILATQEAEIRRISV
jgi:hypothetical protein